MNYREPIREDFDTEEEYQLALSSFETFITTSDTLSKLKEPVVTIHQTKKDTNEIHISNMFDDYLYASINKDSM